jgi:polar amino acid transport system substrate-binding protein
MVKALVILLALVGLADRAQAGAVLDRVMARGELVGAVSEGFPPVAYLDTATGQWVGFDVDVTKAIASRLGVKLRLVTPSWDVTVAGKWADRFDIAVGSMTPTLERQTVLDFPGVYYRVPVAFAVHVKAVGIQSIADLANKRVGACQACSTEAWLNDNLKLVEAVAPRPPIKMAVKLYEGEGTAFDDLKIGPGVRLDAVLANRPTLEAAIAKGYPLRILEPDAFREPLSVAVDKGDPAFSARITQVLRDLASDGTLRRLSVQWFGADLTVPQLP